MPMYEYQCQKCRRKEVVIRTVAARDENPPVCWCEGYDYVMKRVVFPHQFIAPDIEPYRAIGTGRPWITSRSEHREYLRRHDYIEVGDDPSMAPPPDEEPHPHERAKEYEAQLEKELKDVQNSGLVLQELV